MNGEGEDGGPRDGGEDNDEMKEKRDADSVDVSNTNVHDWVDAYVNAKSTSHHQLQHPPSSI